MSDSPAEFLPTKLLAEKHIEYIQSLDQNRNSLAYHLTEHLRMNGVYWGLASTLLLDRPDGLPRQEMINWVMSCWEPESGGRFLPATITSSNPLFPTSLLATDPFLHQSFVFPQGGFRPHPGHDPHIHSTLSAIQILTMQNAIDVLEKPKVIDYILSLFDPERGSFSGDSWGETDARFSYCAVSGLALLGGLERLDRERVVGFISRCQNFDGGFGMVEGAESHAAYVWTCVGTLAILGRLDMVDKNTLGWWLSERQVPNGGLNGRPEKLEDVCYSWWALASLVIIGKAEWIDRSKLTSFILSCQDPDSGGIADRPGDMPDVWHTVFGLAGLSMLGYEGLKPVDPVFCMPAQFTKGLVEENS